MRKIDVSSNLSFDPSSNLASRKIVVLSDLDPDPSAGLDWNLIPDSLDQVESQMDSNTIYYFEFQTWNLALQPA